MNTKQEDFSSISGQNPFRDLWAASEPAQRVEASRKDAAVRMPLGWILGSVAVIMTMAVGLMAYLIIERSEKAMANILAEKGSSLLMAFESALRTAMRGDAGLQLQILLEEMTHSPDIEFVAVTMPDGYIIAHSDRSRLGDPLRLQGKELNRERMESLAPAEHEKWFINKSEGRRVFLVYRHFTLGGTEWAKDVPQPTIFLGLDVSPFEITNSQNRSYMAMLSIVTMLVGLACLLALSYAQRAAESRQRQRRAEGEVHRLEEEVRRNEKLAAVGILAAGVAHEIRNPLSSIKGYATYFRQRFPEGSEDREAATVMVNEVNRLNRVITDLLGLSKPSDVKLRAVCIENVMAHVMRLIRQNAKSRDIEVVCRLAPNVPAVKGDMERLSQALLNLCLNALDAMPRGGRLTIAASGGKKRICLMVRDEGLGIEPEIKAHIFDPYFTTKQTGTGLGLPMAHKIIKAHNGEIDVVSHMPQIDANGTMVKTGDTIFRIWLPVAVQEPDKANGK